MPASLLTAVDLHCYHTAWMAWLHPLNEAGRQAQPSPEYHIRRALAALQGMKRCVWTDWTVLLQFACCCGLFGMQRMAQHRRQAS